MAIGPSVLFATQRGRRAGFGGRGTAEELPHLTIYRQSRMGVGREKNKQTNTLAGWHLTPCKLLTTGKQNASVCGLVKYLSSILKVLCTEHPESFSPGSILSASASWVEWSASG